MTRRWRRTRNWAIGIAVAAAVWVSNLALMPVEENPESWVPPSELYLNAGFARALRLYRDTPDCEVLVMGNSRAAAAMVPEVIEKESGLVTRSLTSGGGYFPFYNAVLTELIPDRLPDTLVLCLHPRDLRDGGHARFRTWQALTQSSGWQFRHTPYSEPCRTIEQRLGDLYALVLPALYYRTQLLGKLRRFDLSGFGELGMRWRQYVARFGAAARWFGDHSVAVGRSRAKPLPHDYDPGPTLAEKFTPFRDVDPAGQIGLWDDPDALPEQTFRRLEEKAVRVILVVLPAMLLERYENNRQFNNEILAYLRGVETRYPNVVTVMDYNNNFDHAWRSPSYYTDLEHMAPATARRFSARFAREAPLRE